MPRDPKYAAGIAMMLAAGAFAAINSPLFRELETDETWKIIFWRNGTMFVFLFVVLAWRTRGRVVRAFRDAGWPGLSAGLILGIGNISFALSIMNTTVANTLFILSASPFIVAVFAWLLMRERVQRETLAFMVAALAGVGIMVAEGLGAGRLFGNVMAVCTMLGHVGFVVSLRMGRAADMLPSVLVAGISAAVVAFAVQGGEVAMARHDLLICIIMGTCAMSMGFIFFTAGSRHVPGAQVALLSLSEVVLGPFLVLVIHGEVPSVLTLIGGGLVLASVFGQAILGIRRATVGASA